MSGIAGIIYFDGRPVEPGEVEGMTTAMHVRGPDGINHWRRRNVALGQCMLRTTPESLEEIQPLTNEDESLVLVMDGRVDNYEDLRRDLLAKGAVLRTRADAELVLRAYEVWGEDCPDRIIGECAFFVWDARRQTLFAARDAAGTRHFYYHQGQNWFAFASEIKGLLTLPRIERRLNESRLLDYLVVEYDRDDEAGTFYQDILRMPAGHAMSVTANGPRIWRYWNPANLPANHFASSDECAEAFLAQLRVAVKCRLRSNGSVGAMLSGGLDSSSIVGLISKEFRADLKQPLKTFTLIRQDRENCADWLATREVLKGDSWLNPTILTSAVATDASRSYLVNSNRADEPFILSSGFLQTLIFDAGRAHGCNVVLDGMGGDLLFHDLSDSLDAAVRTGSFAQVPTILTAYRRHLGSVAAARVLFRRALRALAPTPVSTAYRRLRNIGALRYFVPGDMFTMLHRAPAGVFQAAKQAERLKIHPEVQPYNEQLIHAHRFTTGLLSFAHEICGDIAFSRGIEPRSPFSDRRIIEFAIQMPMEAKIAKNWYKHTLRQCMAGILPEEVRWRRSTGRHPGWKFYELLISELIKRNSKPWHIPAVKGFLHQLDSAQMDRAWDVYDARHDYATGFSLFLLIMLGAWLDERFQ